MRTSKKPSKISKTGPKQPQKVPNRQKEDFQKRIQPWPTFFKVLWEIQRLLDSLHIRVPDWTNQRRLRRQNIKINALYTSRSEQAPVSVFHPRNENIKIDSVFVQGGVDPMIQGGSSNFNILLSPLKITLMTVLGHFWHSWRLLWSLYCLWSVL